MPKPQIQTCSYFLLLLTLISHYMGKVIIKLKFPSIQIDPYIIHIHKSHSFANLLNYQQKGSIFQMGEHQNLSKPRGHYKIYF